MCWRSHSFSDGESGLLTRAGHSENSLRLHGVNQMLLQLPALTVTVLEPWDLDRAILGSER